jgi:hypothetical protein
MSYSYELTNLLNEISSVIITDIDTNNITLNFDILNYKILNRPLHIKYNTKNLIRETTHNLCNKCKKKADYKNNDISLCWTCCL